MTGLSVDVLAEMRARAETDDWTCRACRWCRNPGSYQVCQNCKHAKPTDVLALIDALAAAREARDARQAAVEAFIRRVWSDAAMDRGERARRLLEEAIELAQAEGVGREEIDRFADFIYARPAGNGEQEAAGVGLTLLGYAAACGFSAERAEEAELQRLLGKPDDHWQQRQRVKADAGMSAHLPQARAAEEGRE